MFLQAQNLCLSSLVGPLQQSFRCDLTDLQHCLKPQSVLPGTFWNLRKAMFSVAILSKAAYQSVPRPYSRKDIKVFLQCMRGTRIKICVYIYIWYIYIYTLHIIYRTILNLQISIWQRLIVPCSFESFGQSSGLTLATASCQFLTELRQPLLLWAGGSWYKN